jgi:hypothetical protein
MYVPMQNLCGNYRPTIMQNVIKSIDGATGQGDRQSGSHVLEAG